MTTSMTNFIQFQNDDFTKAKGSGRISTLDRDVDIEAVPFTSANPKAPSHQVFGRSPAGHLVPIGGIWRKKNEKGDDYYTISIKEMAFNANLGRYSGQDDITVQAIIPWEPRD